ncbi:hypothetical protein [Achromobacter denitrificans]|uniref:hypothetical protein n=1 Tax=Achromobacter denitrificans TaxID=32002 RepID=UPI003B9C5B8E
MPRNVQPAAERDGLVTSTKLAELPQTVNELPLREFLRAIDDDLLPWLKTAIETLDQLDEVFKAIRHLANTRDESHGAVLARISNLAGLGSYVAADICNGADCGRERYEDAAASFQAEIGGAA